MKNSSIEFAGFKSDNVQVFIVDGERLLYKCNCHPTITEQLIKENSPLLNKLKVN